MSLALAFPGAHASPAVAGSGKVAAPVKFAGLTIDKTAPGGNVYVGSARCADCHPEDHKAWKQTLHALVVQDARVFPEVVKGDFSVPELPFTRAEVEYTVGSHWDQRYLTALGDEYVVLPRKWSATSKVWEPYNVWSWKKRPYSRNCAGCHMTYFDASRKTIAEPSVGCEACHGPGGLHVAGEGDRSKIVHPARLTSERSNMICASCHVRGTDPSGEYYFPLGFVPGQDLTPLLMVNDKDRLPGEDSRTTISRVFREWKKAIEENARGRCDQCGIKTGNMTREQKDAVKGFCFKCHDYGDRESLHTRHSPEVPLTCYDCHVKREQPVEGADESSAVFSKKVVQGNVHSDSLFRVHIPNCYDPDIAKACVVCHKGGKLPGQDAYEWARDVIATWKKPVTVGH